jgi:hypothetical protein
MKEAKKPTSGTFNRLILLQFPVPFWKTTRPLPSEEGVDLAMIETCE